MIFECSLGWLLLPSCSILSEMYLITPNPISYQGQKFGLSSTGLVASRFKGQQFCSMPDKLSLSTAFSLNQSYQFHAIVTKPRSYVLENCWPHLNTFDRAKKRENYLIPRVGTDHPLSNLWTISSLSPPTSPLEDQTSSMQNKVKCSVIEINKPQTSLYSVLAMMVTHKLLQFETHVLHTRKGCWFSFIKFFTMF